MDKGYGNLAASIGSTMKPFISIILNWLAIRGIGADEALVKAYDRLR